MFPCRARAGQVQGAAAVSLVDAVQGLHQAGSCFGFFVAQLEAQLFGGVGLQVHQHHAGLGVFVAGLVEVAHDGARHFGEVRTVAAG